MENSLTSAQGEPFCNSNVTNITDKNITCSTSAITSTATSSGITTTNCIVNGTAYTYSSVNTILDKFYVNTKASIIKNDIWKVLCDHPECVVELKKICGVVNGIEQEIIHLLIKKNSSYTYTYWPYIYTSYNDKPRWSTDITC